MRFHHTECDECGCQADIDLNVGIYVCPECGFMGLACAECAAVLEDVESCVTCSVYMSNFKPLNGRVA